MAVLRRSGTILGIIIGLSSIGQALSAESLHVKFREGLRITAEGGQLIDRGGDSLGGLDDPLFQIQQMGARWERMVPGLSDDELAAMKTKAEAELHHDMPDQRLTFLLRIPGGQDVAEVERLLVQLGKVEWVEMACPPAPSPRNPPILIPDYSDEQVYRAMSPVGFGSIDVLSYPGSDGFGVTIADVEYSWNLTHVDLPSVTMIGPAPVDPFNNRNHGTAVLGILGARENGAGVSGFTPRAGLRVVAANTAAGYNLAAAINLAAASLQRGDVLLIEQQLVGPNYTGVPAGTQNGLVPVEWQRAAYNAVITAVGNGLIVVAAAGNGAQNLDASVYANNPSGHRPFRPENDSGSIIVGAAAAVNGSTTARSRLGFSNYGSTIDLQGWGERVWTTGFGDAFNATAETAYTAQFGGTSSAAAMVAGAAALVQSIYKRETGGLTLSSREVRDLLRETGVAQTSGLHPATQNIGPQPNLPAAVELALSRAPLAPNAFALVEPQQGQTIPGTITLTWQTSIRATSYRVEIATEPEFVSSQLVIPGVTGTSVPIPPGTLQGGQVHYWRVTAVNTFGERMSATAPRWFVPQIPGCAGDSDRNGKVDFNDITSVLVHWGTGGPVGDADFNQSVNTRDLTIVLLNLGNPCGAI